MQTIFTIGQVLFGGFFLYSGIKHFIGLSGMAGYAASKNVPMAKFAVAFTGLMLIAGGLGVILNFMAPYAFGLIVIFLAITTLFMHNFWKSVDHMDKQMQIIQFTKNLALIGAALMLFALSWY